MSSSSSSSSSSAASAAASKRKSSPTSESGAAKKSKDGAGAGVVRKPVRVWVDGCFDMFHFGHANALRQARELGDVLVVGVHSDADIARHKGPPVMKENERYAAVRACKWADEVVEDAPYVTQVEVLDQYNIDFCVHGDDITTDEDGNDCYALVKAANRYKTIKRTAGVSTTDLVGRMLLMTTDHLSLDARAKQKRKLEAAGATVDNDDDDDEDTKDMQVVSEDNTSPYTGVNPFIPSTRTLMNFMRGLRPPKPDDIVVYIDGAFDLFNAAHAMALAKAKEFGTYLIVGVHSDSVVNRKKGRNYPIMNLHERVLSVLQCRHVNEVVTGAPWKVSEALIKTLGINFVVNGHSADVVQPVKTGAYSVARELGMYRRFQSPLPDLTTSSIVERIIANRLKFEERNRKKQKGEVEYLEKRLGVRVKLSSPSTSPLSSPSASPKKQ